MEDPEWEAVKKYFRKIMNSFAVGLLWMLAAATAGFYFELAFVDGAVRWQTIVFYLLFIATLGGLLWYLYRTWNS